ncbi:NUDIX hydrolase [Listeria grandensis]|uniref:NUDIX hydrolase n=1 Tax=Listeria grandensis TaxID=1494963 RepID=A0A7X0Y4V9_9LIST|nr:NUDIX domain-containing protein [Listeria grandensis]MBC1936959.1 NUDIX hydrolase [Listeria grandensis]MBC6316566.1 NUDIX hydrolase [Listeria grandensis]
MKRVLLVKGFIYNEKKDDILLVKNRDLKWAFPGGRVETDQTLEQALISKVKQQTSVDCQIDSLLYVKERRTAWEHVCLFVYKATATGDFLTVEKDDSVFHARWTSIPQADDLLQEQDVALNKLVLESGVPYILPQEN